MAVNWGLGQPQGGAYDYLDSLQQMGQIAAQKQGLSQNQYNFNRQRTADQQRPQILQQARGGDYAGAQDTAFANGDLDAFKVISGLQDDQRKQVGEHADTIAAVAANLSTLPEGPDRLAAFDAALPALQARGFTPDELAHARGDLSNNGLKGYLAAASNTKAALEAYAKSQAPVTLADGAQEFGATPMGGGPRPLVAENTKEPQKADWVWDSTGNRWLQKPGTGGMGTPTPGQFAPPGQITSIPSLIANINAAEGTGKNPKSSASGTGQMINSTFVSTFRKAFPDQAGLTDAQILTKRGTGVEGPMMETLTQGNIGALSGAGIPVTPGNAYLAHFLGAGGAVTVLRGDPSAPVSSLVPPSVIKANPFLANMSVGSLQQWADRKMGGQASGPQQPGVISMGAPKPKDAPSGYRYDSTGTRLEPIAGGPADPTIARKTQPLTEMQSKATGYLGTMLASSRALSEVKGYSPDEVSIGLSTLSAGNPLKRSVSQASRRVLNAQLGFAEAALRLESGAAVTPQEIADKAQVLFPMPGDGPDVQRDKRRQREAAIKGMRIAAGPGSDNFPHLGDTSKTGVNAPQQPKAGWKITERK